MQLDEYQRQRLNRISDALYANLLKLNNLQNHASSYSKDHFTNGILSVMDRLTGGVMTDLQELSLYSTRKADKEAKSNAKK